MDWFSWLSKSTLEPSLIYEYGLAFARNELQAEDLTYFNHEFLQSMGISVAKHRLEILKLAKKDVGAGPNSISKLILAVKKTKRSIKNCINKLVFHGDSAVFKAELEPEVARYQGQHWRGGELTRKYKSEKELKAEQPAVLKIRRQAKSGPLDTRMQENLMHTNRFLKLSGPLDGKMHERCLFANRNQQLCATPYRRMPLVNSKSPQVPRPLDLRSSSPKFHRECSREKVVVHGDCEDHSLWAALFQDMKPT